MTANANQLKSNPTVLKRHVALFLLLGGLLTACPQPIEPPVVIKVPIKSVVASPAVYNLAIGETRKFSATVVPEDEKATAKQDVTWTSSDPAIASIDSSGVATAKAFGSTTITATSVADGNKLGTATLKVPVMQAFAPVQVSFRPATGATTPLPAGFVADTGAAFNGTSGWITEASAGGVGTPLDVSKNTRDRALPTVPAQLNTFVHMQYAGAAATGVATKAAWEYTLPNGMYTVTVAVGDGTAIDSINTINVEGVSAINAFVPRDDPKNKPLASPQVIQYFSTYTKRVEVKDGRLTIDAKGGTNTKLDYVSIAPGDRPSILFTKAQDGQMIVDPTDGVTADINVVGSGIDNDTLIDDAVQLIERASGTKVPATLNTSGGSDVVVLKPKAQLKENTQYDFVINDKLRDDTGLRFLPIKRGFMTGLAPKASAVAFEQVALSSVPPSPYTSVEIGPDKKLYAATSTGSIVRFVINADGTLGTAETIDSVKKANNGPRTIIGLKFDPASTADNLVLWITNNYFWMNTNEAPDWSGKITKLSGPNLETVQDVVVGLPRSAKDHETNSIAFKAGDPNFLYVSQGSMSAMGAADPTWSNRSEHLLNAAVLRLDLSKLPAALPLNVQTEAGGTYNPYAAGAPLTLFSTGIRNSYDLVWHSNGQLYAPTNGSAAGGNTPATLSSSPACANRPDGKYTGAAVAGLTNAPVQSDYLFRLVQGGYYGHPNPTRCEWVMNGGNPTAGVDKADVVAYPVGTQPDPNYKGYAYDFGLHASPDGAIEEYTTAGNSPFNHSLMVIRYSEGKDIIVLKPGPNGDIVSEQKNVTGLGNFSPSPLDITEDRSNGNLYVAQLDEKTFKGTITLVRPKK
jgi:Bacterial Ig-like domain (group 2)/Bacterial Ig-like domain